MAVKVTAIDIVDGAAAVYLYSAADRYELIEHGNNAINAVRVYQGNNEIAVIWGLQAVELSSP